VTAATVFPISGRESSRVKGARILLERRLTVDRIEPGHAWYAHVRGDERTYNLGFAKGRWWCECAGRSKCSHLVALSHVIDTSAWEGDESAAFGHGVTGSYGPQSRATL